ncbi:hypothetical protein PAHAL_1G303700 [Panicum hallii]|uniref:Uncharacterized protein n=1 Tax=Panicum hallii TaxID=206008 RepID=A0A2S3GQV0_9POAL|nr:hypothetical protein PAHAL_1G303700 [Panicum hallii]
MIHGLQSSLIVSFELYFYLSFCTLCFPSWCLIVLFSYFFASLHLSDCDGLVDEYTILKIVIIPVSSFLVKSETDCSALSSFCST